MMPNLLPWTTVEQQAKHWMRADSLEAMVHDPRMVIRLLRERTEQSTAVVIDKRTAKQPGGRRASELDGYKRKKGNKVWPSAFVRTLH